jgi:hypothetical protein
MFWLHAIAAGRLGISRGAKQKYKDVLVSAPGIIHFVGASFNPLTPLRIQLCPSPKKKYYRKE